MLTRFIHHELVALWRNRRFQVLAALLVTLLAGAVLLGWSEQRRVAGERHSALVSERANWLEQGAKNPHSAAHDGMHLFKPVSPLAWFDPGLEPWLGTSIYLEAHAQNHLSHPPAADLGGLPRFGFLTPAWLLQTLVPLLIILAAAGVVAGERETGTLRQLLALGTTPRRVLLGKSLGMGVGLALLLLPLLAGLVGLARVFGSDGEVARAALAAGVYAIWFTAWLLIAVAVSAWLPNTRVALVVLLACWMSTTLAGPRLISDAVSAALPLPTLTEFNRALRGELESVPDGHNSYDAYWEARKAALLKQHGVTNIAQLPFNIDGLLLQEGEEHANPIIDRHFGALWDHLERQNRLRTFAGLLAPPLALEAVSMALAGSDFAHHRQFAHAAEAQRRLMVKLLNDDMAANSKYGDWDYEAGVALWSKVPEFRYAAPDTAFALRQARTGLGILLTWLLASAGLLLLSARKLKP